ncbi:8252_t:CDS:2, partial [Funneliformis mosseae]
NGEAELADYKNKAKLLFKKMNENSEERCSIESGNYYFHYLIQQGAARGSPIRKAMFASN